LSGDGLTVAFQSFASDLISADYNDKRDVFIVKLGAPDIDADGLDDGWEVAYFGNLSRNGLGDFDSDGVADKDEYVAGTDPTNAGSIFRLITISVFGGTNKTLVWIGEPSKTYRVEFKPDVNEPQWSILNTTITWSGNAAYAVDSDSATNRYYRVVRLP
jgi:hypothetical protein